MALLLTISHQHHSRGGKYEKPVWNLHGALQLPTWLALTLEERSRFETLAGSLQDKSGRSGDAVGQQLELKARYFFNSSLNVETGWTHLAKGEFAKHAPPGAPNGVDTEYFFVQTLLRF